MYLYQRSNISSTRTIVATTMLVNKNATPIISRQAEKKANEMVAEARVTSSASRFLPLRKLSWANRLSSEEARLTKMLIVLSQKQCSIYLHMPTEKTEMQSAKAAEREMKALSTKMRAQVRSVWWSPRSRWQLRAQCQQNSCLQMVQVMWKQPELRRMGVSHLGHGVRNRLLKEADSRSLTPVTNWLRREDLGLATSVPQLSQYTLQCTVLSMKQFLQTLLGQGTASLSSCRLRTVIMSSSCSDSCLPTSRSTQSRPMACWASLQKGQAILASMAKEERTWASACLARQPQQMRPSGNRTISQFSCGRQQAWQCIQVLMYAGHLLLYLGGRFSMKAFMPSVRSSDIISRQQLSRSIYSPVFRSVYSPQFIAFFASRTPIGPLSPLYVRQNLVHDAPSPLLCSLSIFLAVAHDAQPQRLLSPHSPRRKNQLLRDRWPHNSRKRLSPATARQNGPLCLDQPQLGLLSADPDVRIERQLESAPQRVPVNKADDRERQVMQHVEDPPDLLDENVRLLAVQRKPVLEISPCTKSSIAGTPEDADSGRVVVSESSEGGFHLVEQLDGE